MMNGQKNDALARAIEMVGNQEIFAQRAGVSQVAVSKWLKKGYVPAERVVEAERATDGRITRQEFRPDLFSSILQQSP